MSHSPAFAAIRDSILALEDGDRRRLGAILEAAAPERPDAGRLCELLAEVARLGRPDQMRLQRWVRKYVNRWGQVPIASSRAASNAYQRRSE